LNLFLIRLLQKPKEPDNFFYKMLVPKAVASAYMLGKTQCKRKHSTVFGVAHEAREIKLTPIKVAHVYI
jgi:hypothetical protein